MEKIVTCPNCGQQAVAYDVAIDPETQTSFKCFVCETKWLDLDKIADSINN